MNKNFHPRLTLNQAGIYASRSFESQPNSIHFKIAKAAQTATTIDEVKLSTLPKSKLDQIDIDDCIEYLRKLINGEIRMCGEELKNRGIDPSTVPYRDDVEFCKTWLAEYAKKYLNPRSVQTELFA